MGAQNDIQSSNLSVIQNKNESVGLADASAAKVNTQSQEKKVTDKPKSDESFKSEIR